MRHAVLGAGGVGAFSGAALVRAGREVLLLMREESLARYGGVVHVESALLGTFDVELPAAPTLDGSADRVWVTTKATQLADALERVPKGCVRGGGHRAASQRAGPRVAAPAAVRQNGRSGCDPAEIDAIGGSILRTAARHSLDAPTTQALVDVIRAGEP
jgi:ketopantoate reductase